MKLDNTLFWHDAGGCHWCGRSTDSITEGHDGMCPVPLLVIFEAEVKRLERIESVAKIFALGGLLSGLDKTEKQDAWASLVDALAVGGET